MFLRKKKKKSTNSFSRREVNSNMQHWKQFIIFTKLTEDEFFKLWDTGTDMVPMAFALSYAKSNIDH